MSNFFDDFDTDYDETYDEDDGRYVRDEDADYYDEEDDPDAGDDDLYYKPSDRRNSRSDDSLKKIIIVVVVLLLILVVLVAFLIKKSKDGKKDPGNTTQIETVVSDTEAATQTSDYKVGTYKVTTHGAFNLRFRADKSVDAETIYDIPNDTVLQIVEIYHDTTPSSSIPYWGKATYNDRIGWVTMEYLTFVSDSAEATTAAGETTTGSEETTNGSETATEKQTEATTKAPEAETKAPEATTKAPSSGTSKSAGSYVVNSKELGYVNGRTGAGTGYDSVARIEDGKSIEVIEIVEDPNADRDALRYWGKVNYEGQTVYVCLSNLNSAG
ncbi:MAG: hypothetical protein IJJ85_12480 [Clostridia bacterium]|nr:hypothetical protein [Clostridia bacterium]